MVKNSQQTSRKTASQHSLNGLGSFQGNPLGYTEPRESLRSCLALVGIQSLQAVAIKPIDPLSFIFGLNFSHRRACPATEITLVLLKHFRKRNDSNWKCPLLKEILYNRTEKHTIRKRNTKTSEVLAKQKPAKSLHLKQRSSLRIPFI